MRWIFLSLSAGGFVLFDVVAATALCNMFGWLNVPYELLIWGLGLGILAFIAGLTGLRYSVPPNT